MDDTQESSGRTHGSPVGGQSNINRGVVLSVPNGDSAPVSPSVNPVNAANHKPDKRPVRLSALGLVLSLVSLLLSITAVSTAHWAASNIVHGEVVGPFQQCFLSFREVLECTQHTRTSYFAVSAGVSAILSVLCGVLSVLLSLAVLAMHRTQTRVILKFRQATVLRMVATALAGLFSFLAMILFLLFTLQATSFSMSWGFYVLLLSMLTLWVSGAVAGAEWQKSRKLGGDPTLRGDPKGIHAHTISNPHFKDAAGIMNETTKAPVPDMSPMEVHRNGDIAMTHLSGQPYVMGVNGAINGHTTGTNAKAKQKTNTSSSGSHKNQSNRTILAHRQAVMSSRPIVNKTANNKIILNRSASAGRNGRRRSTSGAAGSDDLIVAFDPARTPARSSMRKPKKNQNLQQSSNNENGGSTTDGSSPHDSLDGPTESGGIPNPAFAQSSPPPKKKVRIHTQSTAV